jgi:hypothetical protein
VNRSAKRKGREEVEARRYDATVRRAWGTGRRNGWARQVALGEPWACSSVASVALRRAEPPRACRIRRDR